MSKLILGLDLGSNSIGWALFEAADDQSLQKLVDLGSRIFNKAVEDKVPTPKNVKRRKRRLARRVIQRRARRKKRMLRYLVSLKLLPRELIDHPQPEIILNRLGDPYQLRAKALDVRLEPYELGRVFLHFVQRRGFLSGRKSLLGDLVDDPDVHEVLAESEEVEPSEQSPEEKEFNQAIARLRQKISASGCRTLGEYLATLGTHDCRRNRQRVKEDLRTDRQMYREELQKIWKQQQNFHSILDSKVYEKIDEIIFKQRPIKLRSDRVGQCSLEPNNRRARKARLESQRFRYLQDINNLSWFDEDEARFKKPTDQHREELIRLLENNKQITTTKIRKILGLNKNTVSNLDASSKEIKGNLTACAIRKVLPEWDDWTEKQQFDLVEDLTTIQKKSILKDRLIKHWKFDKKTAINLCVLEFEPGHSNHSTKAIRKLLPYLAIGQIYSDARISAGYGYEIKAQQALDRLGRPPDIPNPIVQKGLYELRRVVNAIVAEYGKPDVIRIEMARDLEMNTKRYKAFIKQKEANEKSNDEAVKKYHEMSDKNPHLRLSSYPRNYVKIKYRLWKDQNERCAYSGEQITMSELFGPDVEIDHILPYSQSLDDSYMNKVVCLTRENRAKKNRTPIDAFGGDTEKWEQITQAIKRWNKSLQSKRDRFYKTESDLSETDFTNNQLNDTRYISKEAGKYLKNLGAEITFTKGVITDWLRYQWNLNSLISTTDEKNRADHRHHAIDAAVIACIDRAFYERLIRLAKQVENSHSEFRMRYLDVEPPFGNMREVLREKIQEMIVSHAPQSKLTGELHEETGVGFIEGKGTVYRAHLEPSDWLSKGKLKQKKLASIVDPTVRDIVTGHLQEYDNDPRRAFADGVTVYHKDGKTPIKRVRVIQAKNINTRTKLDTTKLAIKNTSGQPFKWLAYGNLHHVEIVQEITTEKYQGKFVTMMEAAKRVRGIGCVKQPMVKKDHGDNYRLVMVLHINDLVSLEKAGETRIYLIQSLDSYNKRIRLRIHTDAISEKNDAVLPDRDSTIAALMKSGMKKLKVNAIGKLYNDQKNY